MPPGPTQEGPPEGARSALALTTSPTANGNGHHAPPESPARPLEEAAQPEAARAPHVAFCQEQCPARQTCPLLRSFGHVAKGYQLAAEAYPADLFPEVDAILEGLVPFLDMMEKQRDECALQKHEESQPRPDALAEQKDRLAPLVRSLLQEEVGAELAEIKGLLHLLTEPKPEEDQDEEPAGVDDEMAREIIQDYRARYAGDPAEAMRQLFHETRVGLSQASRLTGWSKSTLCMWKNTTRKARPRPPAQPPPKDPDAPEG